MDEHTREPGGPEQEEAGYGQEPGAQTPEPSVAEDAPSVEVREPDAPKQGQPRARRPEHPPLARWFRWIARVIVLIWVGFWLFFDLASIPHWYGEGGLSEAMIHIIRAPIYIALAFLCWFLELIGGLVLIALSLLAFNQWGLRGGELQVIVTLIFCLPMLIAGLLLIGAWSLSRKKRQPPASSAPQGLG